MPKLYQFSITINQKNHSLNFCKILASYGVNIENYDFKIVSGSIKEVLFKLFWKFTIFNMKCSISIIFFNNTSYILTHLIPNPPNSTTSLHFESLKCRVISFHKTSIEYLKSPRQYFPNQRTVVFVLSSGGLQVTSTSFQRPSGMEATCKCVF